MPPFRFIHCSDLHIDSPFKGLSRVTPEWGERLRRATAQAWDNIVRLALKEAVDAVLIAGDIYDGEDRGLQAQFKFRRGLVRLAEAGIPAFIVCGNHDPLTSWSRALELPETVTVFSGDAVERRAVLKDGVAVAQIYGISFPEKSVTENLARRFQREKREGFAIGLLHANVGGDPHHDNYAPCTLEELTAAGFDYWALGHIHTRRILRPAHPAVVYCGNAQARHFREPGPRGCCLVTLREDAEPEIRFVATDAVRFASEAVDLGAAGTPDAALDRIESVLRPHLEEAGERRLALKVELSGRTPLHPALTRGNTVQDLEEELRLRWPADQVWLELEDRTRGVFDLEQLRGGQDFIADLLAQYDEALGGADETVDQVLAELFRKWKGNALLDAPGEAEVRDLLERARDLTLDHLLAQE